MSSTSQNNDNQEIDLSQISKKIGVFFENIPTAIFRIFLFFKRNIVWVGILIVLGFGIGIYVDETSKVYENKIIVCPNFGSTDYLYEKIKLINSKIEDKDTVFLKNEIGLKDTKKIIKIEVLPILDVYKFFLDKDQDKIQDQGQVYNFELFKLMAEDGDIEKIINESITSKNYPYHLINFVIIGETSREKTINPLLKYLNNSEYYTVIQKQFIDNVKNKIVENDSIISQINTILNTFSKTSTGSYKSDKLVYYNENYQLGDMLKTKNNLVNEKGMRRLDLINLDKIIKENSCTLNITNKDSVEGNLKIILPIFFILTFVLVRFLNSFYRREMAKIKS